MRGGIEPGDVHLVAGLLKQHMYGRVSDPEMAPYHPRVRRGIDHEPQPNLKSASGVGVHALQGRIHPGEAHFRPRVVGVVDVRRGF